jgi:NADH-quinone oxidoreductase subunit J
MTLAATQPDTTATALFWVFALMTGGSALGVVISRNVVRMAVCLLFTLAGVAGLYFLLNAEFLAAVQLVVYAGGTLILIIFGVMLTTKSPFSRFEPRLPEVVIAVSIAAVLLTALVMGIPRGAAREPLPPAAAPGFLTDASLPEPLRSNVTYDDVAGAMVATAKIAPEDQQRLLALGATDPALSASPENRAAFEAAVGGLVAQSQRLFASRPFGEGYYPMDLFGVKLLGDYLLPFEIVSVLLLAVMIGAAYLAKARRREASESASAARASLAAGSEGPTGSNGGGAARVYGDGESDEPSRVRFSGPVT